MDQFASPFTTGLFLTAFWFLYPIHTSFVSETSNILPGPPPSCGPKIHKYDTKETKMSISITYPNHFQVDIYFFMPINLFYKQVFIGSFSLVKKSPLMWLIGMIAKAVKKNADIRAKKNHFCLSLVISFKGLNYYQINKFLSGWLLSQGHFLLCFKVWFKLFYSMGFTSIFLISGDH